MNGSFIWGMLFLLLVPLQAARLNDNSTVNADRRAALEKLTYEAVPKGGGEANKEILEAQRKIVDMGGEFFSRITSPRNIEEFKLEMAPGGEFVFAVKKVFSRQGEMQRQQEIRTENQELYLEEGQKRSSRHKIPQGALPVINGSILIQMRLFPFNEGKEWKIFLMDFSGRTFNGKVRQTGRETIQVPAGVFDCYRLEAVVDFLVIHPKNTFWVAADEPHILIKYDGKRGLFSPTYVTYLVSREITKAGG
jgi:hypothetical protein